MNGEFLNLKLFGPQPILPLVKKYQRLKPKPQPKKPKSLGALKQESPVMQ